MGVSKQKFLNKTTFKLAHECPTKLFYADKPAYANQTVEDPFLLSLEEEGHLVGELAKQYFPDAYKIDEGSIERDLQKTNEYLSKQKATLLEAAVSYENFLVKTDVLIISEKTIEIIEVKAKSLNTSNPTPFRTKKGKISSNWEPYLYDIAFQKFVIQNAFPHHEVSAHLMLVDKSVTCPTTGLNQKFRITENIQGEKSVSVVEQITSQDLEPSILKRICVDSECDELLSQSKHGEQQKMDFAEYAHFLAEHHQLDKKIISPVSKKCEDCEFNATAEEEKSGLRNGIKECWKENLGWTDIDFQEKTVFDIWSFSTKDRLIRDNRIKMSAVTIDDIKPKPDALPGLSTTERQWLQIEKYQKKDTSIWVDTEGIATEMASWIYPLHFIDFETSMAAIPFTRGRKPYEGIAFQFSHHTVESDGTIQHAGQFLNTTPAYFPNYDFIRALKKQLETDNGSIFMYSKHENTFLNIIHKQLLADKDNVEDWAQLTEFIETISRSTGKTASPWQGDREMVDLLHLVKRFYYDPETGGSNSIKQVLPAILKQSTFLQTKYSKPTYGTQDGTSSLNFKNWQWIQHTDRGILDPYKLLPNIFDDTPQKELQIPMSNQLNNGGAALAAYSKMQYPDMNSKQHKKVRDALLKYCELDTLAMVMIYEEWKNLQKPGT